MLIGDMHLKVNNLSQGKKLLAWLREAVSLYRPDLIVNLGDVFDGHAVIRAEVSGEYRAFIDYVLSLGVKYVHILGNHEQYSPSDATYHALQPFAGIHPNFLIVDRPVRVENLYFSPYVHNPDHFPTPEQFQELTTFTYQKVRQSTLFCHQTFTGADFGGYIPKEALDASTLPYGRVVSGHIHIRQHLGKVLYPGSPFAQSAKDVDQTKGVYLIGEDTTFVESPLPKWKSASLEEVMQVDESNDHYVVKMSGTKADISKILSSTEFEGLKDRLSIRVDTTYTDADKVMERIETSTPEITLDNYIDSIYKGNIDRQLLKNTAKKYLSKVNT